MRFVLNRWAQASISLRLALLFCVTFAIGLSLAFLFSYMQLSYSLEKSSKEVISAKLEEISAILKTEGVSGLTDFLAQEKNRAFNAPFMVRVLSADGKTLYLKPSIQLKNFDFASTFDTSQRPDTLLGWHTLTAINDEDQFDILTKKITADSYIQIGKSSEDREAILEDILNIFLLTGAVSVVIGGGVGIWYAKRSLMPIRDLVSTIKEIEAGNLSRRVSTSKSKDELYDLGETFNRMIARIEKLILVMRESLDNVAHDIRTPLSRIRAVAEDALVTGTPEAIRVALEDAAEGAMGISELVDQLLSISEAEAGTLKLHYERSDVKLLVQDVVDVYEFVAQEKRISINVLAPAGDLSWPLDRKRIKQVVGNLLDNAIKFSPNGTAVQLSVSATDKLLKIAVADEGCGISDSDLERIWDRLFRGDRSRSTSGLGLGLSIVRAIVNAHAGRSEAHPQAQGGMTFSITLPQH